MNRTQKANVNILSMHLAIKEDEHVLIKTHTINSALFE